MKTTLVFLSLLALASVAAAQTKITGTLDCGKINQQQAMEVGDKPGHILGLAQNKCTWSKPMEIAGITTKDEVVTGSIDVSGNRGQAHSYAVDTVSNGDKLTIRLTSTVEMKDGAPVSEKGTWTFVSGTGKLKGINGKGSYAGTFKADGSRTGEAEGEYTLPEKK